MNASDLGARDAAHGGANGARHLVLGAATSYAFSDIAPFIHSLRRTGYSGHVALLVYATDSATRRALEDMGVELVEVIPGRQSLPQGRARWRRRAARWRLPALLYAGSFAWTIRDPIQRRLQRARVTAPFHHISSARFFWYYEYLLRHREKFDAVMLTDVRDVLFQEDPFASPAPQPLLFFLEARGHGIGTEPYNSHFVRRLYGRRALRALADRRIVCSGITIGTTPAILNYLELMCDEVARLTSRIHGALIDQGVHNYLIWNNCFPTAGLLENWRGPVLTMGLEAPEDFRKGADGMFVNDDGSKIAVLHQYDRHHGSVDPFLGQLPQTRTLAETD